MVQWLAGPVAGFVSQNWVCKSCPPGALKQQVSATAVLLWQLRGKSRQNLEWPAKTEVERTPNNPRYLISEDISTKRSNTR